MCPNCILNQAGLQPGVYVAYAICMLFFLVAMAAMWWAFRNGEFEDMESSKFEMMDDEEDGLASKLAKARVEVARAKAAQMEQ